MTEKSSTKPKRTSILTEGDEPITLDTEDFLPDFVSRSVSLPNSNFLVRKNKRSHCRQLSLKRPYLWL